MTANGSRSSKIHHIGPPNESRLPRSGGDLDGKRDRGGSRSAVDRIEPASWWTAAQAQQISLLFEGRGLEGATVGIPGRALAVGRVENGRGGAALLVEVTVPARAEPGELQVVVKSKGRAFRIPWTLHAAPVRKPEPFGPDDVIYLIMPDRFADGDLSNNEVEGGDRMLDRKSPDAYHGGDFEGIRKRLPYLRDLGVTAIWLTPIYKPDPHWLVIPTGGPARARRPARDATDGRVSWLRTGRLFYTTNPRFGGFEEYRRLVAEIHRLGMKIIQDQIVGYTGPRHHWLEFAAVRSLVPRV